MLLPLIPSLTVTITCTRFLILASAACRVFEVFSKLLSFSMRCALQYPTRVSQMTPTIILNGYGIIVLQLVVCLNLFRNEIEVWLPFGCGRLIESQRVSRRGDSDIPPVLMNSHSESNKPGCASREKDPGHLRSHSFLLAGVAWRGRSAHAQSQGSQPIGFLWTTIYSGPIKTCASSDVWM